MPKAIKILSFLMFLNITYLHSMETKSSMQHPLITLDEEESITIKDPRLLLEVPNEILANVAVFMNIYCPHTAIKVLGKFSLVCKKLEYLRTPNIIKTILQLDQQELDYLLFPSSSYNAYIDYTPYVELALAMGADANTNHYDLPCLSHASNAHVAQLLIKYGANINHQDKEGKTPLHWAIQSNRIDVAKVLLDNKADIYLADKTGNTPTHKALINLRSECVKALIEHGLDTSIIYQLGSMRQTIADWAKTWNFPEIYKLVSNEDMTISFRQSASEIFMQSLLTNRPISEIVLEQINNTCVIS